MSDRTGGVISFVADGDPLEIEGSFTFMVQSFQRTSVSGLTGPAGHKREPSQPFVEGTCFYKPGISVETLQGLEGVTAQVDLYNGRKIVIYDASQVGEIEVDAAEGTFPLRLEGPRAKEL